VLGVQSRHLRSNQLKDLLFRRSASDPPAKKASVKLVYTCGAGELEGKEAGDEVAFARGINAAGGGAYRVDGKEVAWEAYDALLQVRATTTTLLLYYYYSTTSPSTTALCPRAATLAHAPPPAVHRSPGPGPQLPRLPGRRGEHRLQDPCRAHQALRADQRQRRLRAGVRRQEEAQGTPPPPPPPPPPHPPLTPALLPRTSPRRTPSTPSASARGTRPSASRSRSRRTRPSSSTRRSPS